MTANGRIPKPSRNFYGVEISRSAVKLRRMWVGGDLGSPPPNGGGTNAGLPGPSTAGRVITEWSQRSRNEMRWQLSGIRWEELGERPAMVSLTYPKEWREWAPNGPTIRRHIEAFKERWRRKWGEPIRGVWVREFQTRGAAHWHLYVGLPDAVCEADYDALVRRTIRRKQLEQRMDKYEARRRCGLLHATGQFSRWVLAAWSGAVGTSPDSPHARYGVDVAPFFWTQQVMYEARNGALNWARVADYLWRESGKWGQKTAPEGFTEPGRAWGRWGVSVVVDSTELRRAEWMELRRVLWELYKRRVWEQRGRSTPVRRLWRGNDGVTLFGLTEADARRLVGWAIRTAAEKAGGVSLPHAP